MARKPNFIELPHSAGIYDDFAIRKDIKTISISELQRLNANHISAAHIDVAKMSASNIIFNTMSGGHITTTSISGQNIAIRAVSGQFLAQKIANVGSAPIGYSWDGFNTYGLNLKTGGGYDCILVSIAGVNTVNVGTSNAGIPNIVFSSAYPWLGAGTGAPAVNLDTTIGRDSAGIVYQKYLTQSQAYRIYGTTTDNKFLALEHDGTNAKISTSSGALLLYPHPQSYTNISGQTIIERSDAGVNLKLRRIGVGAFDVTMSNGAYEGGDLIWTYNGTGGNAAGSVSFMNELFVRGANRGVSIGTLRTPAGGGEYLSISQSGLINFVSSAALVSGQMYSNDLVTNIIPVAGQWVEVISGATLNTNSNYFTLSGSNCLKAKFSGRYLINFTITAKDGAGANQEIASCIGVNGTPDVSSFVHNTLVSPNTEGNMGGSTIVSMNAGDGLNLFVTNETSTNDIITSHYQLSAIQIGGKLP